MCDQLLAWLHSHTEAEREALAADAQTSVAYLRQLAYGNRTPSIELVARLHTASRGELTVEGLRPDLASLFTQPKRPNRAA